MSLGAKLTLWLLIPTLLCMTVSAYLLIGRNQAILRQEISEEAERLANTLAVSVTDALRRRSPDDLPRILERAALEPGRFGVAVFDAGGGLLFRWGLSAGRTPPDPRELAGLAGLRRGIGRVEDRGGELVRRHVVALTAAGELLGGLQVLVSLRETEAALARGRATFLGLLAVTAILLILLITVTIRRTITRPLAGLVARVAALGGGQLQAEAGAGDEVDQLAAEFTALTRKLEEARRQLVQESEYARSVIQGITEGIIGVDRECHIRTWNRSMAERYGIPESEVVGRNLFEAFPILEREGLRREVDRLLNGSARELELRDFDHETRQRGRVILNIRGSALRGPADEIVGAVFAIEDVTDRVALARGAQQAEKLAVVGQLAAGIAHQIGTPLNVISGSAEYLMMEGGSDRPRPQELEIIVAQTDRIAKLIRQLLNFARPARMELRPLELNELLREVLGLIQHQVAKERIEVDTDLQPNLPPILGDANQLEQALLNILINAMHAMPLGGTLSLRTRLLDAEQARRAGRPAVPGLEAVIADSGVGIAPEHLPRIFDPFFSTKGVGKGTGLGLAISRRIIEDHHGTIQVESTLGRGAQFTIWLPAGGGRTA